MDERRTKLALQKVLQSLSDPTRRDILNLLKKGSLSAGEIAQNFDISAAAISRHLSVLKDAQLITDRREGKFIFYELNASILEEMILWVNNLMGESDEKHKRKNGEDDPCDTFADVCGADTME